MAAVVDLRLTHPPPPVTALPHLIASGVTGRQTILSAMLRVDTVAQSQVWAHRNW